MFALKLIESVLTNCHELFCKVCLSPLPIQDLYARQLFLNHCYVTEFQALTLITHHLFPLLLKTLSERSASPLSLRGTPNSIERVVNPNETK